MDILICLMLEAYKEYGDVLKYTKDDIRKIYDDNFDQHSDFECNKKGIFLLYSEDYIKRDVFSDIMGIVFIDKEWYLVVDNLDDIISDEYLLEVLKGENDYEWNTYDANVKFWWHYYDEKTLNMIIDFCDEKKLELEEEEILLNKSTLKIKNGDIYINDDTKLSDYINDDDLDELKSTLNNAICEAGAMAEEVAVYNSFKSEVEDKIGTFEQKAVNKKVDEYKYFFNLNIDFDEIKTWLSEDDKYDFEDYQYDNIKEILTEMDYFDVSSPDTRYIQGDIETDQLNEITQFRLEE